VRGIAAFDYDGDGRDDLLWTGTNNATRLWRNLGDWRFQDETSLLGLSPAADYSLGTWGDLDGDGDADLILGGDAGTPTRLLLNDGAAGFKDATALLPNTDLLAKTASINLADFDGDGRIDIYEAVQNAPDRLLLNRGEEGFVDETAVRAPGDQGVSMGAIASDIDADGDLDLYLTYDALGPNRYLRNDGTGHFTEAAAISGLTYRGYGMGIDVGDLDRDGQLDLYVTNLYENAFFSSAASMFADYVEIAPDVALHDRGMGWGTVLFDADQDGYLDVYVSNESPFPVGTSSIPNQLLLGTASGSFELSEDATSASLGSDFGVATADFDGDGDLDLAIATSGGTGVQVLRNDSPVDTARYLAIRTAAIGARLDVFAGAKHWIDEIQAGSGYASQSAGMLHVGLGNSLTVDSIFYRAPGYPELRLYNVPASQTYKVVDNELSLHTEGTSSSAETTLPTRSPTLDVSPNPFRDDLRVRLPAGKYVWSMRSMLGQIVASGRIDVGSKSHPIALPPLAQGTYFLTATPLNGGASLSAKLIHE